MPSYSDKIDQTSCLCCEVGTRKRKECKGLRHVSYLILGSPMNVHRC